jgi:hypothetical protein
VTSIGHHSILRLAGARRLSLSKYRSLRTRKHSLNEAMLPKIRSHYRAGALTMEVGTVRSSMRSSASSRHLSFLLPAELGRARSSNGQLASLAGRRGLDPAACSGPVTGL